MKEREEGSVGQSIIPLSDMTRIYVCPLNQVVMADD